MTGGQEAKANHQRERVLLAALAHVPFDGWSKTALAKACEDAGLEADAWRGLFPGGVPDLIAYFHAYADEKMRAVLAAENLEAMKIRERIIAGVRVRLELLGRHREAVRRLCAHFALPQNAALGLKCLSQTVDAIWRAAGDTATDFSYYTKRATLAGVYTATLLYWLDDDSQGFADTFAFLERRVANVMEMHKAREKFSRRFEDLASRVGSFFTRPPA